MNTYQLILPDFASKVNIENHNSANLVNSEPNTGAFIFDSICIIFYRPPEGAIRTTVMIQWAKLDNITTEKISYYLYSTTPMHSEADMSLDSTAMGRLLECTKESVQGAHHHTQMHWCLLELRPLEQIMTCPATSSFSMHDFDKSKAGYIRLAMAATLTREYSFAYEEPELVREQMFDSMDFKEIAVITNDG